jgi:hypothetical protein
MIDIPSLLQNPAIWLIILFGIIMLVKKWVIRIVIALIAIGVLIYLLPSLHLV